MPLLKVQEPFAVVAEMNSTFAGKGSTTRMLSAVQRPLLRTVSVAIKVAFTVTDDDARVCSIETSADGCADEGMWIRNTRSSSVAQATPLVPRLTSRRAWPDFGGRARDH